VGYRVIEEYLRQGQALAQAMWPSTNGATGLGMDPQKLMERMFQSASDFAALWLEYAQTTMGQVPFAPPPAQGHKHAPHVDSSASKGPAAPPPGVATAKPPPPEPPRVVVGVTSRKRVEVGVEVTPGAASAALVAHDLRAAEEGAPRISGVRVHVDAPDNRIAVDLDVPDDQPPGTYQGALVDSDSNLQVGKVSLRVIEAPGG
jgi:hypothetical protein